ncbi:hypothetical protein LR48_Vigan08g156900 [Vigna angularis]|uniref:Uncharacterized protein n=1 Tax=Phaseolus angularis TaxID=3914 RepID=A0A0L9V733_PHAAN|nr:hypothetical protein LR48_Vigan08g156900 [Vigna angularis]
MIESEPQTTPSAPPTAPRRRQKPPPQSRNRGRNENRQRWRRKRICGGPGRHPRRRESGGRFPRGEGVLEADFKVTEVPGSGADFDIHDGGFGVGDNEVLKEKVGVGAGAVGGGDDGGAVECQEERANGGWDGEGGVEGELGGAPVVFLQWCVELSRIVHQRTQYVVLCHVTRHLVLPHLQHFHNSETEKRGMRKKTPTGSGADFDIHDGGFGVGDNEVLKEKVGVGAGAVGGGDDGGAVECQEERANGGWDGEGGVEGELGGAPVVFLQWCVELSRIVHQRTQYVVLCHVTRHLVLPHLQHFHNSETEKRGMRKKTPTTIQQINKTNYTVWGSRKRLEEEK